MDPNLANTGALEGVVTKLVGVTSASAFSTWRVGEDGKPEFTLHADIEYPRW